MKLTQAIIGEIICCGVNGDTYSRFITRYSNSREAIETEKYVQRVCKFYEIDFYSQIQDFEGVFWCRSCQDELDSDEEFCEDCA